MACKLRTFLSGSVVVVGLGTLAACSGGGFWGGEREPWRKEAEARCIGSGTVREGPGVTRISAINGPGMCGADYPFRVSTLGVPMALSFGDDLRPPASIPNATRASPPRWPINEPPDGAPHLRSAHRAAAASRHPAVAGAAAWSGVGLSAAQ